MAANARVYPLIERCPACGRPLEFVRTGSHEQCRSCGWVGETCCEGADTDGGTEWRTTATDGDSLHGHSPPRPQNRS